MDKTNRRKFLSSVAIGSATLLAGCNGSSPDNSTDKTATTTTTTKPQNNTNNTSTTTTTTEQTASDPNLLRVTLLNETENTETLLFNANGVTATGEIKTKENIYGLPIRLTKTAISNVQSVFSNVKIAGNTQNFTIVFYHNGTQIGEMGISSKLPQQIQNNDWNGSVSLISNRRQPLTELQVRLPADT